MNINKTLCSTAILLSVIACTHTTVQHDQSASESVSGSSEERRIAYEQRKKASSNLKLKSQRSEQLAKRSAPTAASFKFYDILPSSADQRDLEQTNTYRDEREGAIKLTRVSPLSTFSVDVDTASYIRAKSYIDRGLLPPESSIRSEEFINALNYGYEQPANTDDPISIMTQIGPTPWNQETSLLQIGLNAHELNMEDRPPANLVLLIDVSGSMSSAQKLPLLKRALNSTLTLLDERDTISVVTYSGNNEILVEGVKGDDDKRILNAIEKLEAKGSTNMGDGMSQAYKLAHQYATKDSNNRILMFTDGDLNVGMEEDELVSFAKKQKALNIDLTILGMGNYGYHDAALENLSNEADGQYHFIGNYHNALKTLNSSFLGSIYNVAEDVKIQVEFNPDHIAEYRLIGYENRSLTSAEFNNDTKDSGDMGSGQSVTALYEIVWSDSKFRFIDSLKYGEKSDNNQDAKIAEIATIKLRYKQPGDTQSHLKTIVISNDKQRDPSEQFYQAVSAASLAQLMGSSQHIGDFSSSDLMSWIEKHKTELPHGFMEMLSAYSSLSSYVQPRG